MLSYTGNVKTGLMHWPLKALDDANFTTGIAAAIRMFLGKFMWLVHVKVQLKCIYIAQQSL